MQRIAVPAQGVEGVLSGFTRDRIKGWLFEPNDVSSSVLIVPPTTKSDRIPATYTHVLTGTVADVTAEDVDLSSVSWTRHPQLADGRARDHAQEHQAILARRWPTRSTDTVSSSPRDEPNRLLAATFVTTKFSGRARDGFALFRAFLGGTKDPDANRLADSELVELGRRELERALGLAGMGTPLLSRVTRWEQRTPQVELGHDAVAAAVARELQTIRGFYVLANGLGGVGIPDSVQNARAAAASILRYLRSA